MNQQTFLSFKKNKTDKEASRSQADTDNFSGIRGLEEWEGYSFWVFYWFKQMKLYSKASLLRLLDELSHHRYEKGDILSEDEVERHLERITLLARCSYYTKSWEGIFFFFNWDESKMLLSEAGSLP